MRTAYFWGYDNAWLINDAFATLHSHRFTQTDPLKADEGSPYPSAYVYGNNKPAYFSDPSGLRAGLEATASFATKDTPPTTKVIIRKGYRCVKTPASPEGRKKNPLAPSVVTKCTKIPTPTTTPAAKTSWAVCNAIDIWQIQICDSRIFVGS